MRDLRHVSAAYRGRPDFGRDAGAREGERLVRFLRFRYQVAEWREEGKSWFAMQGTGI